MLAAADWMAAVPPETLLSEMSIPGTHDALSTRIRECGAVFEVDVTVQTQTREIARELADGIRAVDIRGTPDGAASFEIVHGRAKLGYFFGADILT